MAYDLPDWLEQPVPKRDWSSRIGIDKSWAYFWSDLIQPKMSYYFDFYTVPSGKVLFLTDVTVGLMFRGYTHIVAVDYPTILSAEVEPFDTKIKSSSVPLTATAGKVLRWYVSNWDIVPGYAHMSLVGWEEPASEPEKPKSDDPEELYRCGDFNYCQIIGLSDGVQVFIFGKKKEEVRHYLKIKDYGKFNQKKLASFHLKPKDTDEIFSTIQFEPKEVVGLLNKFEKKYKSNFFES
jgi:hypothetical protein